MRNGIQKIFKFASTFPENSNFLIQGSVRSEALIETERRSFLGSWIYFASWWLIGWSTGVASQGSTTFWWVFSYFFICLSFRCLLKLKFRKLILYNEKLARVLFLAGVLLPAAGFGASTLLAMMMPEFTSMRHPVIIVCGVLCIGGALILSIDNFIRIGLPIVMLAPFACGVIFFGGSHGDELVLAGLLLVCLVYIYFASGYVHGDYWRCIEARKVISSQLDLLEALSVTDSLTGLTNRLGVDQKLSSEWKRAAREKRELCIMLLDVDNFKLINDTHGHPCGDECLKLIASALRGCAERPADFVGRYGGEEFVVLACGLNGAESAAFAEKIRKAVELTFHISESTSARLSCSIGYVVVHPDIFTGPPNEALNIADQALYSAKNLGRNRVEFGGFLGQNIHSSDPIKF